MAEVAALVGDPGRANMLSSMLDGRAHTATELAHAAGITAPTASGHLARLVDGRLASVVKQGRHRYFCLASADVARMLEGIMVVTAEPPPRARATPRIAEELRDARTCYDHLAGRLGVAIADALIARGAVRLGDEAGEVTDIGRQLFAELGIDLGAASGRSRRLLCRPCLDWSERRPHLAGVVGSAFLDRLLDLGWIRRKDGSRAVTVTPTGGEGLKRHLGL